MTRIAILVLALCACTPSQHDPQRFGTVIVAFAPSLDGTLDWRTDQLPELRAELVALNALGPTFIEASEGAAQIVVRPFDSGTGCAHGVGRWTPGTTFVEIDPACAQGYTELRAAVGHEIGHAIGLSHVCFTAGEAPDCSPVGVGPAMMNPQLSYGDILDAMPGDPLGVAQDTPTALDLDEYRRAHP